MSREYQNDGLRSVFGDWWYELTDARHGGNDADRASLSALRRLNATKDVFPRTIDLTGAITIKGFRKLYRVLNKWTLPPGWEIQLTVAATVLAQVRTDRPGKTTAALLGTSRSEAGGDDHLMAESRFRRLLRTTEPLDLCDQARRAVALLGREAPVGELGASLLLWNARVRRDWATAYWQLDAGAERGPETIASTLSADLGAA